MKLTKNHTYFIIGTVTVATFLLVGLLMYTKNPTTSSKGEQSTTASTIDLSTIATTTHVGGYVIEPIPITSTLPQPPSLNRPIPQTPNIDSAVRTSMVSKISQTVTALKVDNSSFSNWLDLGILRQNVGDYTGAAEAWVYAAKLSPNTGVAYANLGNLYASYIKDYPKAETYYLKGIQNDPRAVNTYRNLFELYLYSYKTDTSAAEDLLKSGISKLPKAVDLKVLLARYYRDKNKIADAKIAYDSAIASATASGNTALVSEITNERNALK